MKSKYIIVLLSLFTAAIVSLMVVQFVQARHTMEISDGLFNGSVTKAMDNVLQQFFQMHPDEFINEKDRYAVTKSRRIDELNNKMTALLSERQDFFFDLQRVRLNVSLRDSALARDPRSLSPSEHGLLARYNSLLAVRNRLVAELEEGSPDALDVMYGDDFLTDGRFNYGLLESVICDELVVNGIDSRPQIGVYNVTTDEFLHVSDGADREALRATPYRYSFRLSRLPSTSEYCVMLAFSQRYKLQRTSNLAFIIISILLIAAIVLIFNSSVKIIFNMRKLDEMKTSFINNMTHEIKTPIATVGLACEMLSDPTVESDEATRRSFLNAIVEENRKMRVLVETILQNAKMSDGKVSLNLVELSLNEVAHSAAGSFRLAMSQRGGEIIEDYEENLPQVLADGMHISNVIHNLIDNAIKYSEGVPYIKLSTRAEAGRVVLRIEDHGIGIAEEDQKHIFERFYRVSTGDVHNVKGFGIGLNYVSNVVAMHHGTVSVESEQGKGSAFIISLPQV